MCKGKPYFVLLKFHPDEIMKAYLIARKKVKHVFKTTNLYELTILVVITLMIAGFLCIIFAL